MRIGILISGRGSNLQSLINAQFEGRLCAEIVMVISNVPNAEGLKKAISSKIPHQVINHNEFAEAKDFDDALHNVLTSAGADLICLAGFMRILGDGFVSKWPNRIINVHPSLLPAFKGLHTHERALEAGVCFTGCTIHFVRPSVDEGPIILQAVVPTFPDDTTEELANRVLQQEHIIYPLAVRMIAQGRIKVEGGKVKVEDAIFNRTPMMNPSG